MALLENAVALRVLKLFGHKKNIEVVGKLSSLNELALNPKKAMGLEFINQLTNLKALKFVLGGMENLDSLALPKLDQLALTMVRGLNSLGDLGRFPELRQLLVQDQKQIESIEFMTKSRRLANIWICNLQSLTSLPGLEELPSLESLAIGETKLDIDSLDVPPSLTHMTFTTGTTSGNRAAKESILNLGLKAEEHPSMPFFYK